MKRYLATLVAIAVVGGCHAPMPSFNMLAPYGPTRIPPPSTGSYGQPNSYYSTPSQPEATPPVGTGFRSRAETTGLSSESETSANTRLVAGPRWTSTRDDASPVAGTTTVVAPARFESVRVEPNEPNRPTRAPIRIVPPTGTANTLATRLRGMHVNDATSSGEPAAFEPPEYVIDISQLPDAGSSRRRENIVVDQAVAESRIRVSSPSSVRSAGTTSSSSAIGWHSRSDSERIRVAGR